MKRHPVIRVHNETDWPPFNFFEDGKPRGFSIDYMNLLVSLIGVKVDYVTGPTWNEFLGMMKSGDLDVMLNIVKTPERQEYLLYTKPYAYNPNSILSRRDAPYYNLEQLFGAGTRDVGYLRDFVRFTRSNGRGRAAQSSSAGEQFRIFCLRR